MKKLLATTLTLTMAFAMLVGCQTSAPQSGSRSEGGQPAQQYELKFNHVLTDKDPYHQAYLDWAEAVNQKTNGGLNIEIFHSAQLGVEEDIIEQIRAGSNVGQNTDSARLGNYVPDIAVMNAPYFVETLDEVVKLNDLDVVNGWKQQLEEEAGIKVLSFFWTQGFRQIVNNKPITTPADLAGQRIRTPGAPIWQESVAAIGATPVALAFSEMYTAIQNKTVDGCENVYASTYSSKLYEVAKNISETNHILLINFAVVSSDWFNSLPVEYQRILEEECNTAGLAVSADILGPISEEAKANLIEAGVTITESADIDMDAFRAAGEKAYENLNLVEARDAVYSELGK